MHANSLNAVVHLQRISPKPTAEKVAHLIAQQSSELKLRQSRSKVTTGQGRGMIKRIHLRSIVSCGRRAKAKFIHIPEEEEFIEDLRRAAELAVIGENYVTNLQRKKR
jgi:hypothetical protein